MIRDVGFAVAAALLMLLPGIAWASWLPARLPGRVMIGPLLGIASTAWAIEMAYYLRLPTRATAVLSVAVSAILTTARFERIAQERWLFLHLTTLYLCCFVGSLLAVSLTVWPAAGPWSVDWSANLAQLNALWSGAPMREWMLARPPLFAAAAVPFRLVLDALPALQVGACAFAGSALVAMLWVAAKFSEAEALGDSSLWVVVLSPFYLVNVTSIVPKFVQGVLIVSAFVLLKGASKDRMLPSRLAFSVSLFCLAIEIHHSTIVYVLAYAALLWYVGQRRFLCMTKLILLCLPFLCMLVVTPELLRISRFGLDEIIRYNPSYAMRSQLPTWVVFVLTQEAIFVGWGYLLPVWNIIKVAHDISWRDAGYYAKWFVFMHQAMVCNTLVLILLPFVFTWSRLKSYLSFVRIRLPPVIAMGFTTVPIFIGMLTPYASASGMVHAGATALAVGAIALGLAWLAAAPWWRGKTLVFTIVLGTVWWVVWNIIQYVMVLRAGGFARSGPVLDDNLDLPKLLASGQVPWGYSKFPWMPLVLAFLTTALIGMKTWLAKRQLLATQATT